MRDIEKCNCQRRISRYRPAGVYIWVSLPCICLVSVLSHDKSWYKLQSKNLMEERKPRYSFLSPPFKCSSWEARNPSCIISHPPLPGSPLPQAYNCLPNIWTIISTLLLLWSCCHISEDMFLNKIISDEKYFSLNYRCIWNILLSEMSVLSPLQRRVCSSLLLWLLHMIAPLSCSDGTIWLLLFLLAKFQLLPGSFEKSHWGDTVRPRHVRMGQVNQGNHINNRQFLWSFESSGEFHVILWKNVHHNVMWQKVHYVMWQCKMLRFSRFRNILLAIYLVSLYCRYKEVLTRSFHYGSFGFIT